MTIEGSSQFPARNIYETEVVVRDTGLQVPAQIISDLTVEEVSNAEASWEPTRASARSRPFTSPLTAPKDLNWDWCRKTINAEPGSARVFGLKVKESFEGLMMISTSTVKGRSAKTSGQTFLYIEYLESAPHNQKAYVGDKAVYKDIGTQLIFAAIQASFDLESGGRVALHSLSTAKTFYHGLRFEDVGFDKAEGLHYYELDDRGVKALLGDIDEAEKTKS